MKPITTTWNKEELKTYILIYCAHADFTESTVEMEYVRKKHPAGHFDEMHLEYKGDNDFISIEKIRHTIERLGFTETEKEALKLEIKGVFLADNVMTTEEGNLMRGLARII